MSDSLKRYKIDQSVLHLDFQRTVDELIPMRLA